MRIPITLLVLLLLLSEAAAAEVALIPAADLNSSWRADITRTITQESRRAGAFMKQNGDTKHKQSHLHR
jgi:hypothetical protein